MDGDGSMARVYLSIYISAASSMPRKEKGAMKNDQVQSRLEVPHPGSQPYLLSKQARSRRFRQNPHVLLRLCRKSTLYE
jgi:hypothetical protein